MNSLLLIIALLSSCSKTQEIKQTSQLSASYYRYLDKELPLTFLAPGSMGKKATVERSDEYVYEVELYSDIYNFDPSIPDGYSGGWGSWEYAHLFIRLQALSLYRISPGPGSWRENITPNACYGELPYAEGEKGLKRIEQNFLVRQEDGTFIKKTVPAKLFVYQSNTNPSTEELCPEGFPCWQEIHRIFPELPQGMVPKGKYVAIEARYTVTNAPEPEKVKVAKKKANEQVCKALKNIAWIQSPKLGSSPKWENVTWSANYPLTTITVREE